MRVGIPTRGACSTITRGAFRSAVRTDHANADPAAMIRALLVILFASCLAAPAGAADPVNGDRVFRTF